LAALADNTIGENNEDVPEAMGMQVYESYSEDDELKFFVFICVKW